MSDWRYRGLRCQLIEFTCFFEVLHWAVQLALIDRRLKCMFFSHMPPLKWSLAFLWNDLLIDGVNLICINESFALALAKSIYYITDCINFFLFALSDAILKHEPSRSSRVFKVVDILGIARKRMHTGSCYRHWNRTQVLTLYSGTGMNRYRAWIFTWVVAKRVCSD